MFGLMVLLGYIGWKLLNNDLLWAGGVFLIGLSLLMLVYNFWLAYEFKLNYTGSSPDAGLSQIIFYIFMIILTCGLMTAAVLLVTKWKVIKDKFKSAIKPEEEDKDDLI
jgi:energy-coupling factor transporter transmembrane protein EcfT